MDEKWSIIDEFPTYKISTFGVVVNRDTNRQIRTSVTPANVVKVGLVKDGRQYTRSVAVLVAEAFVKGKSDTHNTPIHLDGNHHNNHVDNLAWRSRGFAWKYVRQFIEKTVHYDRGPIINIRTNELYTTIFEAAISNGLLVEDLWRAVVFKKSVFPTNQKFDFV